MLVYAACDILYELSTPTDNTLVWIVMSHLGDKFQLTMAVFLFCGLFVETDLKDGSIVYIV